MKFSFGFLTVSFLCGFFWGALRFIGFWQTYADPSIFRQLPAQRVRWVLTQMVDKQEFSDVKKYLRWVYPSEDPSTHGIGHVLGEVAYQKFGGKAFGLCDPIFNYGCYHGVVDMAIRTKGLHISLAQELRDACAQAMKDPSPCIHPLGHASTILAQYNTLAAFRLCDALYPDPRVAFSCWNGAMMEYINRSAPNAPKQLYGDPNDPYRPCNTYPPKYEASCVAMHMSYLLSLWGHDFPKLLGFCLTYDAVETKNQCIDAVGAMIGQTYFDRPQEVLPACEGAGDYQAVCVTGAIVPFATARQKQSVHIVCDSLKEKTASTACYDRFMQTYHPL